MALIWADGFDDYDYDAAAATGAVSGEYELLVDGGTGSNDVTIEATGRRGSGALKMVSTSAGTGNYVQKALPAAVTEIYAAFAFNPGSLVNAVAMSAVMSGTTTQVSFQVTTAGAIEVRRGVSNGTILGATASGLVAPNAFTHIQYRVVISDTVGVVQIKINGGSSFALNLTNVDTNNAAAAISLDAVRLGYSGGGNITGSTAIFDDFVIWDASGTAMSSWVGDVRVDSYVPNAEGDTQNFATSSGTAHYSLVNGASPVSTSYVQSANVGDVDLYQFADMVHTPVTIYGVVATAAALKDDAGSRSVRLQCKSAGTTADNGADITLSTTRTRVKGVFETNPATGAAWTKTAFNAAQFGVKVTV